MIAAPGDVVTFNAGHRHEPTRFLVVGPLSDDHRTRERQLEKIQNYRSCKKLVINRKRQGK